MNKRRQLLIALGTCMLMAPLGSFAQQPGKVRRLGYLSVSPGIGLIEESFRQDLRKLGYVEGQNIAFEWRFANGKGDLLPALAAELVRLKVDIIVASLTPAIQAAKQASTSIPIVMAPAGDPVGAGLIASLARPGGNLTGVSSISAELVPKNLELIREVLPSIKRVGVLANAIDPFTKSFLEQIQAAARTIGIELQTIMVRGEKEFDAAFTEMVKARAGAVIVQGSLPRKAAAELALKHRLPAVAATAGFADDGALMSYAANFADLYRDAALYVDKILKGANPADLPVAQPTKFELAINMKTAKALGIKIPQALLLRADKVIE